MENNTVEGPYNLKRAMYEKKYFDSLDLHVTILKEVIDVKGDLK